jgi:hypothetical protein
VSLLFLTFNPLLVSVACVAVDLEDIPVPLGSLTSNLVFGLVVPIPTFPSESIRNLSTKLLAADVKNAKCASSLFVVSAPAMPLIWATNLLFHCQFIFARVCPALPLLTLKFICLAASFGVVNPTPISPPTTNL